MPDFYLILGNRRKKLALLKISALLLLIIWLPQKGNLILMQYQGIFRVVPNLKTVVVKAAKQKGSKVGLDMSAKGARLPCAWTALVNTTRN